MARSIHLSREDSAELLRNVILWLHAGSGAIWIAACACFVIAGLALDDGTAEQRSFARSGVRRINQLAIAAASILLITGAFNIAIAAEQRHYHLRASFMVVLLAKIAIFILMGAALGAAWRTAALTRQMFALGNEAGIPGAIRRMVRAHFAIVALGSVALVLGLWLVGS
jgi:hypothetical protein